MPLRSGNVAGFENLIFELVFGVIVCGRNLIEIWNFNLLSCFGSGGWFGYLDKYKC